MRGRSGRGPKENFFVWWGTNVLRLLVYLLVVSTVTVVLFSVSGGGISADEVLGGIFMFFLYYALFSLPGIAVWLIGLGFVPPEWSSRRRRIVAVVSGSMIGVPIQLVMAMLDAWLVLLIWGLLVPMGAGYVVVLRRRMSVAGQAATTGVSSAM